MSIQTSFLAKEDSKALDARMKGLRLEETYSRTISKPVLFPTDIKIKSFENVEAMRESVERLNKGTSYVRPKTARTAASTSRPR
jgi:hypothetical protein